MCPKNIITFRKGLEDLWFIGEVGGIYYYADSGLKNWTDARAFCVEYGLHLSIITTNDQWNLLASAFNTTAFSGKSLDCLTRCIPTSSVFLG
ncbi:C-type lectin domain family 4 member F [Orchesella cincta]|uniref:C-type lectin domain family 4 member F n=1 Tax=Orchesella cincta TaxID=48709 RepID=A0A1D2MIP0_ORCCI|nr:C-type lectin domain family 4 member F [Orchesella cincta]